MIDIEVLRFFLTELEIDTEHMSLLFEVLEKIEAEEESRKIFSSFYTPYKEKGILDYQSLIKECLPKLWDILGDIHNYKINYAILFALAPHSEHFYLEKGHSHNIWIDSILDLKWKMLDCVDITGFAGIRSSSLPWFDRWFSGERFAFHRLQFEINPSGRSRVTREVHS